MTKLGKSISLGTEENKEKKRKSSFREKVSSLSGKVAILLSVVNLFLAGLIYRQVIQNERLSSEVRKVDLIDKIYALEDCSTPPCKPKADIRLREDAINVYIKLEKFYGRTVRLRNADLAGLDLSGVDLSETDLSGSRLQYANLSDANLRKAHLVKADLRGALLSLADLSDADLSGADLKEADFTRAELVGSVLVGATLGICGEKQFDAATGELPSSASLRLADLRRASFENALLCGVDVRGSDLSSAHGLTQEQIDSAIGDSATMLPLYFSRPKSWF